MNPSILLKSLTFFVAAVLLALPAGVSGARPKGNANPDFTKGESIPEGFTHDWNLGPTGARGWIFSDKLVTTDARQISITKVEKGSPAEGVFLVGDVILGVSGKPFSYDPRTEFGKALTIAESDAGGGKLTVTRWRAGKAEEITVKLPVLGTYNATAPYDCPKSKRILEQGCKALAEKVAKSSQQEDPIVRSLNALALLASGRSRLPPAGQEGSPVGGRLHVPLNADLALRLRHDAALRVCAGDRRPVGHARPAASCAGSRQWSECGRLVGPWVRETRRPPRRLRDDELSGSAADHFAGAGPRGRRERPGGGPGHRTQCELLRFYIGKGAIPYGDHHPWIETHEDNGKCGMAAVLFNLLGEAKGAEFFSRMSLASHGPERDTGHTGNFFNILWSIPGVAQSGPQATGAWMNEFGAWYFDLARRWDGTFLHQGPPEPGHDSYGGWDCTGVYLLAYAMPLKKIYLTGKRPGVAPQLDAAAAQALILDGRGWSNKDRNSAYDTLSEDQLLERLGSWSPVVRERAAMALGRRKDAPIPPLLKLLESPALNSRYGACQALIALRGRGAPAIEALRRSLTEKDLWLRIKAAEALAAIGAPAMQTVPQLLELLAQVDPQNDPRGMQQRYLSFALFDNGGMLSRSLDGVDREALYKAVRAGLKNQDGRARGSIGSVYRNLSAEEIKPLLPAIYQAIIEPAPSGEMFADSIRVEGLRLLAKHRIEEGISACVKYTRDQNPWASQERTPELMKILLSYGTHAKSVIPELTRLADYFEKDEKDFPKELMLMKAKCVRETIRAIEASTDSPELIRLK